MSREPVAKGDDAAAATSGDAESADPATAGAAAAGATSTSGRDAVLKVLRIVGAVVGYGCFVAFLCLISLQSYRWLEEGEWTHIGVKEGLHVALEHCCVKDGDTGRLAALVQWLDIPQSWLGLHRLLELLPASLALFAFSILGNSIFIYCRDRLRDDGLE